MANANAYQNELFERLNKAFEAGKKENSRKDILKLVPGNSYIVRMVPNVENLEQSIVHYYMHGWGSEVDGKYMTTACPTTNDDDCPICKEYFRLYNKQTDESIEQARLIKRKTRLYANVYVVDDPVNPENNDTVKILSYGVQLEKVIQNGWSGDDKDEVGLRMFDFTENGCNLRIKVEKNSGGFPEYTSSKFLNTGKINTTLDDIKDQIHDISALVKIKSQPELKKMLALGLINTSGEPSAPVVIRRPPNPKPRPDTEDIPMDYSKDEAPTQGNDVLDSLNEYMKED